VSKIKCEDGFTLLEVLLMVTIFAILLGVASPLFRNTYENIQMEALAENLAALCTYAWEQAVLKQTTYRLVFPFESRRIRLEALAGENSREEGFRAPSGLAGRELFLPEGIDMITESSEVLFYPEGATTPATVFLQNKNQWKIRLSIEKNGNVLLEKLEK